MHRLVDLYRHCQDQGPARLAGAPICGVTSQHDGGRQVHGAVLRRAATTRVKPQFCNGLSAICPPPSFHCGISPPARRACPSVAAAVSGRSFSARLRVGKRLRSDTRARPRSCRGVRRWGGPATCPPPGWPERSGPPLCPRGTQSGKTAKDEPRTLRSSVPDSPRRVSIGSLMAWLASRRKPSGRRWRASETRLRPATPGRAAPARAGR